METLAFLHGFVAYEDPGESPKWRSPPKFHLPVASPTALQIAGQALAVSIITAAPIADAAVQRGEVCATVRTVQQSLMQQGHDPGPVDGIYGGMTEYAVMRFQQKSGLTPSGIVDAATASALGLPADAACGTPATSDATHQKQANLEHQNEAPLTTANTLVSPQPEQAVATRVVLKRSERMVYVYQGQKELAHYPVAVGKPGWETPIGTFRVSTMLKHPGWTHPLTGEVLPPGSNNPLGERWIEFWSDGFNSIGFHGTPDEHSIGQAASHGCVRLYNEDVRELYQWLWEGIPVVVEP